MSLGLFCTPNPIFRQSYWCCLRCQVYAGKGIGPAPAATAESVAALLAAAARVFTAVNLTGGTYYDVYLAATDAAGNKQLNVTNIM